MASPGSRPRISSPGTATRSRSSRSGTASGRTRARPTPASSRRVIPSRGHRRRRRRCSSDRFSEATAIRVRPRARPVSCAWGLRFLRECTAARARRNTIVKLRLCQYSQAVMTDLVRAEGIEYHAVTRGALYVFRGPARARSRRPEDEAPGRVRAAPGSPGRRQVARLDPRVRAGPSGRSPGRRDVGDSSGDSSCSPRGWRRSAATSWASPCASARVHRAPRGGDRVTGAVTSGGVLTADAYVLRSASGRRSSLARSASGSGSTRPRATPRPSRSGQTVSRRRFRVSTSSGSSAGPAGRPTPAHLDRRVRRL